MLILIPHVNTLNGFLIYVIKKTDTLYEKVHYTLLPIHMLCIRKVVIF